MIKNYEKPSLEEEIKKAFALQSAIRIVITHIITDAFNLTEAESIWTSHHINRILEPLNGSYSKGIALPVVKELKHGIYSKMMFERKWDNAGTISDSDNRQASLQDWAQVISNIIFECYQPRPIYETSIVGQITGVLLELGVGNIDNPRKSSYLPTSIQYQINKKRSLGK